MAFEVDNKVITTSIETIVNTLKQQLNLYNIDKLSSIEKHQNNIVVTCPIHKGGHERTPSCEILLNDKIGFNGVKTVAGTVHCFGCGYSASITKFIADCLDISYREAIEWLLSFCSYSIKDSVRDIYSLDDIEDKSDNNYKELPIITIEELKSYDYIHPYMFERKLTDEVIKKFEVGYDPKTNSLTFPVYVNSKCLFVAKRRVDYKRFDMPSIRPKPIYGLDYITSDTVYICESVINALTIWSYGLQAVALFGTGSEEQIRLLDTLSIRKFVLALDPDEAGDRGCLKIAKALKDKIITKLNIPRGRDVNDLSREEFFNLEENIV